MLFPRLFVFLGGCVNQAGSLVLKSSPMLGTEGELFTLVCSSNTTDREGRYWNRDDVSPVFITARGCSSPSVSNPDVFNRYMKGRVSVSCAATQHNVTLRINSTIDNGSMWQCGDYPTSQRSNTFTIYTMVDQTTTTYATSVPTTTTDITPTGSAGVETSKLENTTSTITFNTTIIATTTTSNNNNNNTNLKPISTTGSSTTTNNNNCSSSNNNNNNNNNNKNNNAAGASAGQSDTIAIATGAAGGGVAVIAAVIVAAVCIRNKRRSVEEKVRDKSRRGRNPSRSSEMLIESGVTGEDEKVMMDNIIYSSSSEAVPAEYSIQGHNQADKVMQENILYTSSSDIAPADYRTEDPNPVCKDVYTEVKKVKTNSDEHEVTDMYAKPHKGRKETPNGDMYAQVNKVKSRKGTSGTTCENNIEDMYAKPQKDKQNVKSNADTD